VNQDASPKISRKALEVEQARLARFFETINKHHKALDLAVEQNSRSSSAAFDPGSPATASSSEYDHQVDDL
jgi:hypothetical protein